MADFSAGEAITAGFGVIRRRPAVILAWAAAYFVGFLPQLLLWSRMAPLMAGAAGHAPDPNALQAFSTGMMGFAPLLWIWGLLYSSVLYGAAFRAVLYPDDDRYLYLRLSSRELWLGLTMLALLVVFAIGCVIVGVVIGILSQSVPGIVIFLLVVAAIVAFVWLAMRFSLATTVAFAERRFVFADVWPLTAGHTLKLLGVALAVVAILIGLELALMLPVGLALSLSGAFKTLASGSIKPSGQWLPWMAVFGIGLSLFGAVVIAVVGAPWANIYRQLTPEPAS